MSIPIHPAAPRGGTAADGETADSEAPDGIATGLSGGSHGPAGGGDIAVRTDRTSTRRQFRKGR